MDFFHALFAGVTCRRVAWPFVVAILYLPAQAALAQKGELLTLPDAIARMLAQNPELAVFPLQRKKLAGDARMADLRPAFDFRFETERKHFGGDEPDEAPDPEDAAANELELVVALSSVVELGGKRQMRVDVVSAQLDVLIAEEQARALDLLGEVIRRYAQVLAAEELVVLAKERVSFARDTLKIVNERVLAAASPASERMRAEATLAKAVLAEQSERNMLVYRKYALSALWGQPGQAFEVDARALYRFAPGASFEELYARAQENPAIARFASEERLQASQLRLVQAKSSPDLGWYAGILINRAVDETTALAGFNLPLFTAKRNRGALIGAEAELEAVALRRKAALLQLYPQLYLAVTGRKQALDTVIMLQGSVIPSLRQALGEVKRAYRRGRDSYTDLIAAREMLLNAERSRIEAARSVLLYGAEIEQLTARPLGPLGLESRQ